MTVYDDAYDDRPGGAPEPLLALVRRLCHDYRDRRADVVGCVATTWEFASMIDDDGDLFRLVELVCRRQLEGAAGDESSARLYGVDRSRGAGTPGRDAPG